MDLECVKRAKPTFCREWLNNENYRSWVQEDPNDNGVYICTICKRSFSCSSRISKHAATETHRQNTFRDPNVELKQRQEARKREFFHSWLEKKQFKPWLEKIPNDPYNCFCSFCKSTFRCGLDAVKRHSGTKKHIVECQKRGNEILVFNTSDDKSSQSFENRKRTAEIRYAAFIVERDITFYTGEAILSFFQELAKDPHILEYMTMNRSKGPQIINKVLYVREQERVIEILQGNKFSIFIDETTELNKNRWMTFLVRYVDTQTMNAQTELFELIPLNQNDNCSTENLFRLFENEMQKKQIPLENILAVCYNNDSTIYEPFTKTLQEYCENLIIIPCPSHASTLVVDAACKALPEMCEELLQKMSSFISRINTTLRSRSSRILRRFQKSFFFNDKKNKAIEISETRWLLRHSSIVVLNQNWDTLLEFFRKEKLEKKSVHYDAALLSMLKNQETKAYFLFLEYIFDAFNKYNSFFETQQTKVYVLQSAAEDLLKDILRNVVKTPLLNFAVSGDINPFLVRHRRSPVKVGVGRPCQNFLEEMIHEGRGEIVKSIYATCLSFYNVAVEEIRKQLFVKDEFLSKLNIFEPKVALFQENEENKPQENKSIESVLFVANQFGGFDEDELREEWQSLHSDFTSEDKKRMAKLSFDEAWKAIITIQDADGKFKFPMLTELINIVRSLPNSSADSKSIFSMLTNVTSWRRNQLCPVNIQAMCMFKSSLKARGETAQTMKIDSRHLALMSPENLSSETRTKRDKCLMRLFGAAGPSTSSDL